MHNKEIYGLGTICFQSPALIVTMPTCIEDTNSYFRSVAMGAFICLAPEVINNTPYDGMKTNEGIVTDTYFLTHRKEEIQKVMADSASHPYWSHGVKAVGTSQRMWDSYSFENHGAYCPTRMPGFGFKLGSCSGYNIVEDKFNAKQSLDCLQLYRV